MRYDPRPLRVSKGRRKPYTEIGVRRFVCSRSGCDQQATSQWSACADDNLQRPLCEVCDVALNALVLRWMADPNARLTYGEIASAETKINAYADRMYNR